MTNQDSTQRPYLVRAMHEWMTDTGKTPHLLIDVTVSGVQVPAEHIQDGKIVLNCSYSATKGLILGNEEIEFEARFGGRPHQIRAPIESILGIYARDSGEGILFTEQEAGDDQPTTSDPDNDDDPEPPTSGSGRSHLRVVK